MVLSSIAYASSDDSYNKSRFATIKNDAKRLSKPLNNVVIAKGKEQIKENSSIRRTTLILKKIQAIKTSEKGGDELYFDVLEFGNDRKPKHFHIPTYPHHWPSFVLNKIKDIKLWQGALNKTGQVNLIVSLLEKDAPPWALNDLIGSFKITISLKDGIQQFILQKQGVNFPEHEFSDKFQKDLNLSGDDGEYQVSISMQ